MRQIFTLSILVLLVLTTGCSFNHPVAKDYDQFLVEYGADTTLPKSDINAEYQIENQTQNHNYQFRAVTVGYAHVWIVEFGKILDKTINSDYVQTAFGKLSKNTDNVNSNNLIEFELESFSFEHYRAYTSLKIKVLDSSGEIFNKTYHSEGGSQGGKMWGAGPFGMKNATLQSTKQSIDKILTQFINDTNRNNLASN